VKGKDIGNMDVFAVVDKSDKTKAINAICLHYCSLIELEQLKEGLTAWKFNHLMMEVSRDFQDSFTQCTPANTSRSSIVIILL